MTNRKVGVVPTIFIRKTSSFLENPIANTQQPKCVTEAPLMLPHFQTKTEGETNVSCSLYQHTGASSVDAVDHSNKRKRYHSLNKPQIGGTQHFFKNPVEPQTKKHGYRFDNMNTRIKVEKLTSVHQHQARGNPLATPSTTHQPVPTCSQMITNPGPVYLPMPTQFAPTNSLMFPYSALAKRHDHHREMHDGYWKIIKTEHAKVECSGVHESYKPVLSAGLGFGASKLDATQDLLSEHRGLAANPSIAVRSTPEGRENMLKLSKRMMISFAKGISTNAHEWTRLPADQVRIMTTTCIADPGTPTGVLLNATTTFCLPVSPKLVFDFLCNVNYRHEWDILTAKGSTRQMSHIAHGPETGHNVSLLRVKLANSSHTGMVLQESYLDQIAAFVVYSSVSEHTLDVVFNCGKTESVPILPSGFYIVPDRSMTLQMEGGIIEASSGGSILTMGLQGCLDSNIAGKVHIQAATKLKNLVKRSVHSIKHAISRRYGMH